MQSSLSDSICVIFRHQAYCFHVWGLMVLMQRHQFMAHDHKYRSVQHHHGFAASSPQFRGPAYPHVFCSLTSYRCFHYVNPRRQLTTCKDKVGCKVRSFATLYTPLSCSGSITLWEPQILWSTFDAGAMV